MKKPSKKNFIVSPEFSTLLESIKSIIRSYKQRRYSGATLPKWMEMAKIKVSVHKRSVSMTDTETGERVLIIHEKWIPLFTRLEKGNFSENEISALKHMITDKNSTELISRGLAEWAEKLA